MGGPADNPRGLSAAELAAAATELRSLVAASVLDVVPLTVVPAAEDLLLVLQRGEDHKQFVHIALGGPRARVTTTTRRFTKAHHTRQQTRDVLRRELEQTTLYDVITAPGERRCEFVFRGQAGERTLVVELFGARGLWALLDGDRAVLALSRTVETAVRSLRPGDPYRPPPAGGAPRVNSSRFAAPVLAAIDACFTAADLLAGGRREHEALHRAATRALHKATQKSTGMRRQLAACGEADAMRAEAGLMLAYAHDAKRGAKVMTVYDPETNAAMEIDLDPRRPVAEQARALFDKARRLTDGRAVTEARLAEAEAEAEALRSILAGITAIDPQLDSAIELLAPQRAELERMRALPAAPKSQSKSPSRSQSKKTTAGKAGAAGENYRRFVSAEGYQILVGRNNAQNDRLTMRVAKGNDLWLHVGGGRPGSHVVIRLPKLKTASLETLLDAATLAVHFSKARGERRIDVIYTQKKHVRKPKGLPPGAVVPSQTRTVTVDRDEGRLRRLLDSAGEQD